MIKYYLLGIFLLGFSNLAAAGQIFSGEGEVVDIMSNSTAIVLRTTMSESGACSNPGGFWWPISVPHSNNMFAIAVAALTANKKVVVIYNTSALNCNHGGSAEIISISIR